MDKIEHSAVIKYLNFKSVTPKAIHEDMSATLDRLQKLGYRVDLAPVEFENYCLLEICGHEVFRCNLQNLSYSTPWQLDPVCQRAVEAVVESTTKFGRARSCLWSYTNIEENMFRNKYGPQDYFPNLSCKKCCNIRYTQ